MSEVFNLHVFDMKEGFSLKIRMFGGKIMIEIWEYTNFLKLQVPYSHYSYHIEGTNIKVFQIH